MLMYQLDRLEMLFRWIETTMAAWPSRESLQPGARSAREGVSDVQTRVTCYTLDFYIQQHLPVCEKECAYASIILIPSLACCNITHESKRIMSQPFNAA